MKTKMKRQGSNELPRFAVGALALAATTASSQAATVQITLTGNKISSTGGNQLVADLTGDTNADVTLGGSYVNATGASVTVKVNGQVLYAAIGSFDGIYWVKAAFAAGLGNAGGTGTVPLSASYLNPITFTDPRINGGITTEAWLQVNAFNTSAVNHTVELSRLIFDDANTTRPAFASIPGAQTAWSAVPEPSSLGLLALGAGGLLARRRRAMAA